MDNEFNVGDIVLVHKPSNLRESPGWNEFMDCFDGNEYPILEVEKDPTGGEPHILLEDGTTWWFNTKWVEHVDVDIELDDDDLTNFIGGFVNNG